MRDEFAEADTAGLDNDRFCLLQDQQRWSLRNRSLYSRPILVHHRSFGLAAIFMKSLTVQLLLYCLALLIYEIS